MTSKILSILRRLARVGRAAVESLARPLAGLARRLGILERLRIGIEDLRIRISKTRRLARARADKPSVMMLADVRGWAWDYKAQQIARYLSDEFEIHVLYWSDFRWGHLGRFLSERSYDVYFTFECNFVQHLRGLVDYRRLVTGVTAHTYVNFQDYKRSLRSAYAVHANSRMLWEEVRRINPRCHYLPNGVDEAHFALTARDPEAPFTAGYVGKRTKRKGLDEYLVPACERAGVRLKTLTAKYNHADKISRERMPEFYYDMDVVLIASDMDGTPNQLLEAAAVGRTFIANRIGNVPEFAAPGNGFVVPREVDAYVEKLLWLKAHRQECLEMGRQARQTVERDWTWKAQAERYRRMFQDVLEIRP